MLDFDSIQQELVKLGLTETQAKIYALLVEYEEMRIQDIVKLAGIPRSSVYENLKKLYELGIAEEIVDHSHKKIRPYPIGTMRHGIDEKVLYLRKLSSDIEELEKSIAIKGANTPDSTVV